MFSQFDQRLAALEEQHKDVVSRLQESHFQVSCLRGEILELREENAELEKNKDVVSRLQEEITQLRSEIDDLKKNCPDNDGMVMIGYCDQSRHICKFVGKHIDYSSFIFKLNNDLNNGIFMVNCLSQLPNITLFDFKDIVGGPGRYDDAAVLGYLCGHSGNGYPRDFSDAARDAFKRAGVQVLYDGKPI